MRYILCLTKMGTIEDVETASLAELFIETCTSRGIRESTYIMYDNDCKKYGVDHVPALVKVDDDGVPLSPPAYGVFRKPDLEVWLSTGYLPSGVYELRPGN